MYKGVDVERYVPAVRFAYIKTLNTNILSFHLFSICKRLRGEAQRENRYSSNAELRDPVTYMSRKFKFVSIMFVNKLEIN